MAAMQMDKYQTKMAAKADRENQKLQKKSGNVGKRALKKQPSQPRSDSEHDWEVGDDSEGTSDVVSEEEVVEVVDTSSAASCSDEASASE